MHRLCSLELGERDLNRVSGAWRARMRARSSGLSKSADALATNQLILELCRPYFRNRDGAVLGF